MSITTNSSDSNLVVTWTGTALTVALFINTHTPPPSRSLGLSLRKREKLLPLITTLSGVEECSHVSVMHTISIGPTIII
jgi:hypothetical protein